MHTLVSFVVASSLLVSTVSPAEEWAARGKAAFTRGDYCESYYYRKRALDVGSTTPANAQAAIYYAFQSAYAADLFATANELLHRIDDPKMRGLLAENERVLQERAEAATLSDAVCTHGAVCGDMIVDAREQCDDGNAAAGDGCDAACKSEAPIAPPPATTSDDFPWLIVGGVVGGAVVVGVGVAAVFALNAPPPGTAAVAIRLR